MKNTRAYFELAQVAEASYANLLSDSELDNAVRDAQFMTEVFSPTQAAELDVHWNVAAHHANTQSEFTSTLFRNTDPDDAGFVLAILGTEGIESEHLLLINSPNAG